MKISAVFVVRNEIDRIADALKKIRPHVDEIVVVDQSSDDGTPAICSALADVVVTHPAYGFCEASRQEAIDLATGDWILLLDADEEITNMFAIAMRRISASTWLDCFETLRRTEIENFGVLDEHHIRFFRRGSITHANTIHTAPEAKEPHRIARGGFISIRSVKSAAEQSADDERYKRIMGDAYYRR